MPEKIGRYIVGQALGAGAHGAVWQAEDTLLGRTVALKLLKPTGPDTEGFNKSLQEAQTLAKLNHPNIVTLYEISEHDGQHYLVMEYLDGVPLHDYLATQSTKLSFEDLAKLMAQLVDALKTAHAPANIIVRKDGCPVLVDFGLAKTVNASTDLETVTDENLLNTMVHGTLAYMSPEVMRGEIADEKSDIFSLGAVFYEMLYGERAFKAPSDAETVHLILNVDPAPSDENANKTPEWAGWLANKMLAKKREDRFEKFTDIQDIINDPTAYYSDGKAINKQKKRKKRIVLSGAIAAVVALTAIAGTQYGWQSPSVSGHINAGLEKLKNFEEKSAISEAKAHFQTVLITDPENAAATAGYSLALLGEYTDEEADPTTLDSAEAAANLAIELDDQLALAYTALARAKEYQGLMDDAKQNYEKALSLDPSEFHTLEGYGHFLWQQGKLDEAAQIYRKASTQYPQESLFYTQLGEVLRFLGEYDEAEDVLRTSLSLSPDNVLTHLTLSAVLYSKNDLVGAIAIAQQGLQIRPHSALYGNLGTFYFTLGQYGQAINSFERAIDVDGNSHSYLQWANLADAYRMNPETTEKAKIAYKRALQLLEGIMQPNDSRPTYVSRAGLYHAKAGEPKEAVVLAAKALALAPSNSSVLFRSAVTYDLAGERTTALSLIKQALDGGYPISAIKSEPDLAGMRNDPRYHQLLAEREDK